LVAIQLQNHQNVKKKQFWQKVPGVNGLNKKEEGMFSQQLFLRSNGKKALKAL